MIKSISNLLIFSKCKVSCIGNLQRILEIRSQRLRLTESSSKLFPLSSFSKSMKKCLRMGSRRWSSWTLLNMRCWNTLLIHRWEQSFLKLLVTLAYQIFKQSLTLAIWEEITPPKCIRAKVSGNFSSRETLSTSMVLSPTKFKPLDRNFKKLLQMT